MNKAIVTVLKTLRLEPVLLDVGASGCTPGQWATLAPFSTYVGFDPDSRVLYEPTNSGFRRALIFNRAVTERAGADVVEFNLAKNPPCSSVLPLATDVSNYLFADLFEVERRVTVPAVTLDQALRQQGLPRLDWLKLDTQGTDWRLYRSLPDSIRSAVLAVDIEPGLINAYQGEDLFVMAHAKMLQEGFWLSSLDVKGSVRMRRSTMKNLQRKPNSLLEIDLYRGIRASPGWCEARYLRSLEHLSGHDAAERDYALLWCIAMMENQFGFALDIADEFESRFGTGPISAILRDAPLGRVRRSRFTLANLAKRWLPGRLKAVVKRIARR